MADINDWQEVPAQHAQINDWQEVKKPGFQDSLPSVQSQVADLRLPAAQYAQKQMQDPMARMAIESGQGGPAQAAGETAAGLAKFLGKPLTKAGDYLMQKAVGMRRYLPGVGETLADQGVIGTQNMMRNQIEKAMETTGQKLGSLAKSVPEMSTRDVAETIGEKAAKLIGPDGKIMPENVTEFNHLIGKAGEISSENAISGETAAFRRMQQGRIAKNAGRYRESPAQGLKAQSSGAQQAGYSQALKNASPQIADLDTTYGNLAAADAAAARPETISNANLIGKFVPTSLAQSAAGRALIGTSNSAQTGSKYFPMLYKMLTGKDQE